jgi:hypothetical protein
MKSRAPRPAARSTKRVCDDRSQAGWPAASGARPAPTYGATDGIARDGIALVAVVLALVVLEAAVAGALFICSLEAATTGAFTRRAHVLLAAESALAAALDGWDANAIAGLAAGDTLFVGPLALPSGSGDARVERLRGDTYLVTGRGKQPGPGGNDLAGASALVGWHAPAAFASHAPAALVVGGATDIGAGGLVDASGTGAGCTPADTLAAATFPTAAGIAAPPTALPVRATGATVLGAPAVITAPHDSVAFTRFGPYLATALAAAAERVEVGSIALGPAVGPTGCDRAAPGNWGAHHGSGHPCEGFVPLVHAPGDLSILGGTGFGLVLVDGDLTLEAGAVLHGIALVRGRATVRGELRGLLRAAAGADVGGTIVRDACAIWRALTRARPLSRPFRPDRWRLPWF